VVVGTDRGIAQVRRILAPALVMQDLERGVDVVPLAHADARKMVQAVEKVGPRHALLTADERTNSILVQGSTADRQEVVKIARALDVPQSPGARE
jgi:type II secretory pathway component GspD/PulD (secretin)